jgi:hypothetical protein
MDEGNVGDSSDIQKRRSLSSTQDLTVKIRDEWRSLPSRGDISRSKIGHDRFTGPLRDHTRLTKL